MVALFLSVSSRSAIMCEDGLTVIPSAEVVDEESVVFSPSNLTFVLRFLNLFDFPFIFKDII